MVCYHLGQCCVVGSDDADVRESQQENLKHHLEGLGRGLKVELWNRYEILSPKPLPTLALQLLAEFSDPGHYVGGLYFLLDT